MNKGNKKSNKRSHKNKEAIKFVLANRELDDPNINNPNVPSKILLQMNKDEELTSKQRQILNQIPKELRGVYDEEAKLKKLIASEAIKKMPDNDLQENNIANQMTEKKVKFDFSKSEIIPFEEKAKIKESKNKNYEDDAKDEENQEDEIINSGLKNKIPMPPIPNIDDDKYIDELFKRAKVNAKIVEYNEYGLEKDIDPAFLEFVTNKEFREEVDIFVPPLRVNEYEFNKFHTDIKPEDMNDEYKEVDAEFNSDSEKNKGNEEQIVPSSKSKKEETKINEKNVNELEDDFILLANEGQLPVEFIDERLQEETKQKKDQNKSASMKTPSYKYITKEELEFVNKKFAKEFKANQPNGVAKSKKQKSAKEEFDEAVEEMLQYKKRKEILKQKEKVIEDEGAYEEYESLDEEDLRHSGQDLKEEYDDDNEEEEYEEFEDEWEEEEENEEDEKGKTNQNQDKSLTDNSNEGKPKTININGKQIAIEYMDKSKEPDPFSKEDKAKTFKKEKKKRKQEEIAEKEDINSNDKETFTFEDLEKLVTDKEIVEKTIELFNHHEMNENEQDQKRIDDELDNKFIHEPKRRDDITSAQAKIVNLPKTINAIKRKSKKAKVAPKEEEKKNLESEISIKPIDIQNETTEQKKLRKKLIKLEKKEKRKENKKVKNAFKNEKKAQSHQIAEANKVFHYGLSVKEL